MLTVTRRRAMVAASRCGTARTGASTLFAPRATHACLIAEGIVYTCPPCPFCEYFLLSRSWGVLVEMKVRPQLATTTIQRSGFSLYAT